MTPKLFLISFRAPGTEIIEAVDPAMAFRLGRALGAFMRLGEVRVLLEAEQGKMRATTLSWEY